MILYRYIARKFWPPFLFGMGIFAVLVFLADMFEKLKYMTDSPAPARVIVEYFLLIIPFWTLVVVPVAALLSALFVVSGLIKSGEWVAASASGYSPRQIVGPILACAALVAVVNAGLGEFVSPRLHARSERILQRDIRGKADWGRPVSENVVLRAGSGVMLYIARFSPAQGHMTRPVVNIFTKGKAAVQIDAEAAEWNKSIRRWVFRNGIRREMSDGGTLSESPFENYVSGIDIAPRDIVIEKVWPEDLSVRDILRRVKSLRKTGTPDHRERTYLQVKFAAPFASFIICLLGIPFGVIVKKGGNLVHFATAMCITFVFWWALSMCQSAGEAGMVPPWVAAWAPIGLFGGLALFGMKKAGL